MFHLLLYLVPFPSREDTISTTSSNFCLESGLSKGLTAVWWVPLGWCIASDVCPDWLPPALEFACILSESYPAHAFYEVHSRLDWRKVGVDWLWGMEKMLLFLSWSKQPEIGSTFDELEIGFCAQKPLSLPGSLASMVAAQASKPQSVQKDDLTFVTAATGNEHATFISVNKFLLIFLPFKRVYALLACVAIRCCMYMH